MCIKCPVQKLDIQKKIKQIKKVIPRLLQIQVIHCHIIYEIDY